MDMREGITNKGNQVSTTKGDSLPFDSESFKAAWDEWKTHRKEIGKKLTPTSTKKQFAALRVMGEAKAIEAISHSIKNEWKGIFPPKAATDHRQEKRSREFEEPKTKIKML